MDTLNRFFDMIFTIAAKALTTVCAVGFVLDKVFDINLIKFF
jgi:hypothetical protein